MDIWMHLERQMKIKRHAFQGVSSSRRTWRNYNGSFLIEQTQFKRNDSHKMNFIITLDQRLNSDPTVTPKSLYKLTCSSKM